MAESSREKLTIRPPPAVAELFSRLCDRLGVTQTALLEAMMEAATVDEGLGIGDGWPLIVARARQITASRRRRR